MILSHLLYLVDRDDLFRVVSEANRVLTNQGILIVIQFLPQYPRSQWHIHQTDMMAYFQDYSTAWTWHPGYCEIWRQVNRLEKEDRSAIVVLKKSLTSAYPQVQR